MSDFLTMGGYGFYVWGAYGVTALALGLELLAVRARRHRALEQARASGTGAPTFTASEAAR